MSYDVIILGCGPVGAVMANLLGAKGYRVAVLDQNRDIYDKPRAINLDHEIMRVLQFCGLADRVAALTARHPGTRYLGVDGEVIKIFDPAPPPYPLGWYPNLVFVQPEIEAVLRDGLARYPRVETFLGWRAIEIGRGLDSVTVTLSDPSGGDSRVVDGRYLLGCDGAASFVRRTLALPQEDLAFDEGWLVVDSWLRGAAELPDRCVQYCWPSRPATFIIGPRNLRRWEIKLLPGERPEEFSSAASIRAQLARFVDPDAIDIWRAAVYRFHALVATRWREGRVFILGDAAHQMPPFMGQGLCAGIRDAANLAWKLDLVMQGVAGDTLLDSYEAERKPHIRDIVATTKAFGEIIGELDEPAARRRDRELGAQLRAGTAQTIRQKFIPDLTAGLIDRAASGAPAATAGTLFVQPRLHHQGGEALLDDVVGPCFLIVAATREIESWLDDATRRLWRDIGGRVIVISEGRDLPPYNGGGVAEFSAGDPLLRDWLAEHRLRAAVIRPDRYVYGGAADAAGLNRLAASLARQLGRSVTAPGAIAV